MTQRRGVRPGEQRTVGAARGKGAGAPEPRSAPGNPDGENGQAAREAVLAVMPAAALATGAGAQGGFGLVEELGRALVLAGAGVLGLEAREAGEHGLLLGGVELGIGDGEQDVVLFLDVLAEELGIAGRVL